MYNHAKKDKSFYIQKNFPITDQEYEVLDKKYGKLCWDAARKLAEKNRKDKDTLEDYHSEVVLGMCRGGSYYKRQMFIETSFILLDSLSINDEMHVKRLKVLKKIWFKNKESFGLKEERDLRILLNKYKNQNKSLNIDTQNLELQFDDKFHVYCKSIIWNTTKAIGQDITKEKRYNKGMISLDEFGFLCRDSDDCTPGSHESNELIADSHFYNDEYEAIRNALVENSDTETVNIFDIISDPQNEDKIFKKSKAHEIKLNIVRQKSKMSYCIIYKKIKLIKEIIETKILNKNN